MARGHPLRDQFAAEEAEHGYEEEEVQGRCAAILSNGRRCPNAALPGRATADSRPTQALTAIDSDNVADLTAGAGANGAAQPERAEAEIDVNGGPPEPPPEAAVASEAAIDPDQAGEPVGEAAPQVRLEPEQAGEPVAESADVSQPAAEPLPERLGEVVEGAELPEGARGSSEEEQSS